VREDDDVAQRQHRVGPGLTGDQRRLWLCASHGPRSFCCAPRPSPAAAASRSSAEVGREGSTARPGSCTRGWVRNPPRRISKRSFVRFFVRTIGGDGSGRCQVSPKIQANSHFAGARRTDANRIEDPCRPRRLQCTQALASPVRSARSA
jgi:hypothetical protein